MPHLNMWTLTTQTIPRRKRTSSQRSRTESQSEHLCEDHVVQTHKKCLNNQHIRMKYARKKIWMSLETMNWHLRVRWIVMMAVMRE